MCPKPKWGPPHVYAYLSHYPRGTTGLAVPQTPKPRLQQQTECSGHRSYRVCVRSLPALRSEDFRQQQSNCCLDKSSEVIGYKNFRLLGFIILFLGVMAAWLLQAMKIWEIRNCILNLCWNKYPVKKGLLVHFCSSRFQIIQYLTNLNFTQSSMKSNTPPHQKRRFFKGDFSP